MCAFKHQVKTFTTLGSDMDKYCFIITHGDNSQVEIHKRSHDGFSTFDENSFITAIPTELILKYAKDL